jgi:hypothetical protein
MRNQFIHLISNRIKCSPDHFGVVRDKIGELKLIVIGFFKRVDFSSGGKALVDLFLGDVLKFTGLIFDTDDKSHELGLLNLHDIAIDFLS